MPRWILGCFAVVVMFSGAATAGPVAPNEVCTYEHARHIGARACFRLEPGMRHKLVPTLGGMNDRASSVHVGEEVWVVYYEHAHFAGLSIICEISISDLVRPRGPIFGVRPNFNDLVSSMIIVPKASYPPRFGVALIRSDPFRGGDSQVFYPLPERLTDLEARYPNLHWMDMNDKAKIVRTYGSVEVTLYEHANFLGQSLTIPGVGPQAESMRFYLDRYHFGGLVSSLVVRKRGP